VPRLWSDEQAGRRQTANA